MKWVRGFILLLVALALVSPAQVYASQVTVTVWANTLGDPLKPVIERFEAQNPDIKIDLVQFGGAEYLDKLTVAAAGGALPDVYVVDGPEVPAYASGGFLLPISGALDDNVVADWVPVARTEAMWDREIFAVPLTTSAAVLTYNKSIFDQAGIVYPDENWTWADLTSNASRLTRTVEDRVVQYGLGLVLGSSNWTVWMNLPYVQMTGTDILDEDGNVILDPALTTDALEFLRDLTSTYGAVPTVGPTGLFRNGTLAMMQQSAGTLAEDLRLVETFEMGTTVLPHPEGGRRASGSGGWQIGVSSTTTSPAEATAFVSFVASEEGLQAYLSHTGSPLPVRRALYPWIVEQLTTSELEYLRDFPYEAVFQALEYGLPRPRTPKWPELGAALGEMFGRNWFGPDAPGTIAEETVDRLKGIMGQ